MAAWAHASAWANPGAGTQELQTCKLRHGALTVAYQHVGSSQDLVLADQPALSGPHTERTHGFQRLCEQQVGSKHMTWLHATCKHLRWVLAVRAGQPLHCTAMPRRTAHESRSAATRRRVEGSLDKRLSVLRAHREGGACAHVARTSLLRLRRSGTGSTHCRQGMSCHANCVQRRPWCLQSGSAHQAERVARGPGSVCGWQWADAEYCQAVAAHAGPALNVGCTLSAAHAADPRRATGCSTRGSTSQSLHLSAAGMACGRALAASLGG